MPYLYGVARERNDLAGRRLGYLDSNARVMRSDSLHPAKSKTTRRTQDKIVHTDAAMWRQDIRAQQCLLPAQLLVQHVGLDRMRLQQVSVDAHLSVLRSEMQLLVHTSIKMMTIEGMPTNVSTVLAGYTVIVKPAIKVGTRMHRMLKINTIEAIARPQMVRR